MHFVCLLDGIKKDEREEIEEHELKVPYAAGTLWLQGLFWKHENIKAFRFHFFSESKISFLHNIIVLVHFNLHTQHNSKHDLQSPPRCFDHSLIPNCTPFNKKPNANGRKKNKYIAHYTQLVARPPNICYSCLRGRGVLRILVALIKILCVCCPEKHS